MGLLKNLFGGGAGRDGVRGTAQVVSATGYHEGHYARCKMNLVLQAEGIEATAVQFDGIVHNKKWPRPGMTLPVSINPDDPTRYEILWDDVPRSDQTAQSSAEAMAAAMRGEGGAQQSPFGNAQVINLSGGDLSDLPEDKKAKLRMLGLLPPKAEAPAPAAAPADDDDDRLEQLERLVKLRDAGALTEDEFAAEKARILDQ